MVRLSREDLREPSSGSAQAHSLRNRLHHVAHLAPFRLRCWASCPSTLPFFVTIGCWKLSRLGAGLALDGLFARHANCCIVDMLDFHPPPLPRVIVIVLFLLFIGLLSIIGAVRLDPSLRASREAQAIADIRAVLSAEQNYASANSGFFDELTRLCSRGPECEGIGIPDYPPDGPDFIDGAIARRSPYTKSGFERECFEDGRPPTVPGGASPTSVFDYRYRATPKGFWDGGAHSFIGSGAGAMRTNKPSDECRVNVPLGDPLPCPTPSCPEFFQ